MARKKERLDKLMVQRGLAPSRSRAQALVMAGEVLVAGQRADKAGMQLDPAVVIEVQERLPYVGRGGLKLAAALDHFGVDPKDRCCADVGASTGGFTDVLLQRGAARVYAIDVGYGQLDWKLRQDRRVRVMERTNARHLEALPERVSLVVLDLSFISLRLVLPAVRNWLTSEFDVIALVKPQFEAGRGQIGKGGIVKDPRVHRQVLEEILAWASAHEYVPSGLTRSPITGAGGNVEFLVWLRERGQLPLDFTGAIAGVTDSESEGG